MKPISLFLATCLLSLAVIAQNSVLTVNVRGNVNREVIVDGTRYTVQVDINNVNTQNPPIVVNNLLAGQHTIRIVNEANRQNDYVYYFTTRNGYDMTIQVNNNGTIRTSETASGVVNNIPVYRDPMTTANFNKLLLQVRNKRRGIDRQNTVKNAFSVTGNYFSSNQARQLIQYVNSQSSRFDLAKLAYPLITDPNNFNQVADLLYSQAKQNELEEYIVYYNSNNQNGQGNTYRTPMSTTAFNNLYRNAGQQYSSTQRRTYISNAFANQDYYFTTAQAMKLIGLVSDDASRLFLAKASFRGITDPENFSNVNTLLYTQTSRNELAVFVRNYNDNNSQTSRVPWTDAYYNNVYKQAQQKWSTALRVTYLNGIFSNTSNFYTANQARQLILLVNGENERLQLAKSAYRGLSYASDYTQLNDLFSYQSSRNELSAYANAYNNGNTNTETGRTLWTDYYYNNVYTTAQQRSPSSTRVSYLAEIFANPSNYYTVEQAKQLIRLVNGESDRLQLAKSAYRGLSNFSDFSQMNDLFSYQSSRSEFAVYVSSYQSGNPIVYRHMAMADEDFRTVYRNVQNEWLPFAKMTALQGIFNNNDYYFTSTQARQLIQLVSSETNRLELAKLAYGNVVDPENFTQLYDLLSLQSSRDELATYVKSYAGLGQ